MDKAKKKNIKRIIALGCAAAVVALLAAMPLLAGQEPKTDGPQASILSGTAETGSISTELIGGGTLTEEDAVSISVPSSVKLTEYLVSNGDIVSEGDSVAYVDRVTVMTAISKVQETLDHLAEEIEAESKKDTDSEVAALAGGTVKIIYAAEGDSAQDVMLEHGALAVLSLDGIMAADITAESDLAVGTAVTVTLSDGTAAEGKIESNLAGEIVVTMEDDGYSVGESVEITEDDGTVIGTGELYIYSPWNAAAYTGTVGSVNVSEGETVDAGYTLMELTDAGYSAAYRQLLGKRQEYEELMLELFEMYQTETVTAPCDGVISSIDEDSVQLLTAEKQSYTITFLANAPNGDDSAVYTNYIGKVTAIGDDGWTLNVNPQSIEIADYMELSGIEPDTSAMTEQASYDPAEADENPVPVYELTDGAWVQADNNSITAGDILLFACDDTGRFVWIVRVQKASGEPSEPEDSEAPTEPSTPSEPSVPTDPNTPTEPSTPAMPDGFGNGSIAAQPNFTYPSADGISGDTYALPQDGMTEQESETELYSSEVTEIAAVTPQSTVTLDITINELDIAALELGMSADIKIDALGGEKFTAAITDISNTGTNNGGYSYFTVELTMERTENMLAGMNASAVIVSDTASDILTIPADALVEDGTDTVVYTGYDEENEILTDPVPVTVGISDGQNVEILDGLSAGDTYYYAYYDTPEISFTPDFGRGGFSFGR